MKVRLTTLSDIEAVMEIYDHAREFMRSHGNATQWNGGYPSRDVISEDIIRRQSFVIEENGMISGVFAFIKGEDPTYAVIEDGKWPDTEPYGTIHRIASSGKCPGILRCCVDFCLERTDRIRLDTHADNTPMRYAAESLGFVRCGIIHVADGTPRIAFQLTVNQKKPEPRMYPRLRLQVNHKLIFICR